jgi:hypothetical protein
VTLQAVGRHRRRQREWHERIGARLAEAWRLPTPLPAIIGSHHQPPTSATAKEATNDDGEAKYRLLVQFADVVCALLSLGPYVPYDLFGMPCAAPLRLTATPETESWLATLPGLVAERAGVL